MAMPELVYNYMDKKMKFHVITGLPRSGSTLLQNILNQNLRFWATTTSPLSYMVASISNVASNSIEVKAMLDKDREGTEERLIESAKAFVERWHAKPNKEVVFDKSRTWAGNALMLNQLYPDAKLIVMVRDLRAVFGSVEKQHRKNPIFDEAANLQAKAIYDRADKMFGPEGIIGMPIIGIEDLIRRNVPNAIYVQYETFVRNPQLVMERIYTEIDEDGFKHDFENVVNTAEDPDGFYLHKFPHDGSGKVKPNLVNDWEKYVSPDLANTIMQRFAFFNNHFGYK